MKKMIMAVGVMLLLAGTAWGTSYTGSIGKDAGLYGTEQWVNALLAWTVDDETNSGYWTYDYTFTVPKKDISHVITEVSDTFTTNNIKAGTTTDSSLNSYCNGCQGNSNPGMPAGGIYGLKWDGVGSLSATEWQWTIVTDRMPMWGDFYAKDGKSRGNDVYAYNTQFGKETTAPIGDGNAGGWVLVPNTQSGGGPGGPVPEPATILMLSLGMLLLVGGGWWRRRREKP